jgi:predicted RNA-binding protein with PUA-like domain
VAAPLLLVLRRRLRYCTRIPRWTPEQDTRKGRAGRMRHWLMKSEPDVFGIDDLERVGKEPWDGIRNYQARNFMRDDMKVGDLALFYHSNAKPMGVVGLMRVSRESHPDHTAFDPEQKYFDPKSDPENPRWMMVEVEFVEKFPRVVTLKEMKENPRLEEMLVVRRGQRLSIQPVERHHFEEVLRMAREGTGS